MQTKTIYPNSGALAATGKTAVEVQPSAAARLLFVDYMRVFLTILVLLHHLMITYTGSGSWIYTENRQDVASQAIGSWFCFANQAYFMGLFLLISAYFVPGSYDRKGAARFLKDRLIRLGIPLAVYSWIISPIFVYLYLVKTQGLGMSLWDFYSRQYFRYGNWIGAGPLWFVETLLIFSGAYVVWRLFSLPRPLKPASASPFPKSGAITVFALLLGLAGFLVRLRFPVDWNFAPLNLQFPFFAQYIALFILGLIAYRRDWFNGLPEATGRRWLALGGLLVLAFPPLALLLSSVSVDESFFNGGWHWQALLVALYESFLCLSLCIGLLYAFRRYANRQGRLGRALVPAAYGAYIIHAPVIVAVALAMRDIALHPLLKFGLAALVSVPICFGLASLMRKLPYAERVL